MKLFSVCIILGVLNGSAWADSSGNLFVVPVPSRNGAFVKITGPAAYDMVETLNLRSKPQLNEIGCAPDGCAFFVDARGTAMAISPHVVQSTTLGLEVGTLTARTDGTDSNFYTVVRMDGRATNVLLNLLKTGLRPDCGGTAFNGRHIACAVTQGNLLNLFAPATVCALLVQNQGGQRRMVARPFTKSNGRNCR